MTELAGAPDCLIELTGDPGLRIEMTGDRVESGSEATSLGRRRPSTFTSATPRPGKIHRAGTQISARAHARRSTLGESVEDGRLPPDKQQVGVDPPLCGASRSNHCTVKEFERVLDLAATTGPPTTTRTASRTALHCFCDLVGSRTAYLHSPQSAVHYTHNYTYISRDI